MGLPCAICGAPIDYSLPPLDPMSYELDEIVPVSLGGSELDYANVQPVHRLCNQRKGARLGFTCEPPTRSEIEAARRGKGRERSLEVKPERVSVTPSVDWSR